MNAILKTVSQSLLAGLAAFSVMGIASATSPNDPQKTDRKIDQGQAEQRAAEFLERLFTGFQHEQRDNSWATREESRLRAAFMGPGLAPGDLKSVECRSTQCQLEISSSINPLDGVKKQLAVRNWLGTNVPCAYTMVAPVDNVGTRPSPVRVYVNCGKTDMRARAPRSTADGVSKEN
jgi:hypothetical protein